MLFPFKCTGCGKRFDGEFPIGKAPRELPCPSCQKNSKRIYEGMSIGVKVDGVTRSSGFGEQMKARNAQAAYRMKGRKPPVRLAAWDHGNGDVREAAK